MSAKLSDDALRRKFYELYKEGATDAQIAAAYSCGQATVNRWRHSCGLPPNGKRGGARFRGIETPESPVVILGSSKDMGDGGLGGKAPEAPKSEAAEKAEILYKIAYELGIAFGKGLKEGLNL